MRLKDLGLIETKSEEGSHRVFTRGFIHTAKGGSETHVNHFLDIRARLTPAGRALVESLPPPKALPPKVRVPAWKRALTNPASVRANDPTLTVKKLHLRRLAPGLYEHANSATGTEWRIFHDHGDTKGVNHWIYFRTDADAWQNRAESQAQDTYATKADAAAALVDRLNHRRGR